MCTQTITSRLYTWTRIFGKPTPMCDNTVRLQQGESVKWVNDDGAMVCKWKDKQDVFMIVTNDAGEDVTRPTRRHPQMINLPVPTCVGRYNARTLSISTTCAPTTVWDELAGVGGSTSSGGFSTSASSMRMCSG